MSETIMNITIKGTKPLLMHSNKGMLVPKTKVVKSSSYDIEKDAALCLYKNDAGTICIPSMAILSCMRKAAVNLKKGGAGKKTLKDYVYSGLQIDTDMIPLTPQEYIVDVQMVVVARARIPRARPLFKNWSVNFNIIIMDEQTWDVGNVRQILTEAGKYQGLLDFRPLYGTFEVVSVKVDGKEVK